MVTSKNLHAAKSKGTCLAHGVFWSSQLGSNPNDPALYVGQKNTCLANVFDDVHRGSPQLNCRFLTQHMKLFPTIRF